MSSTLTLSDVQVRKLLGLQEEANNAMLEAQQAQKAALQARQRVSDMVEVVLDAHGAPETAQIDLQHGVIILPEEPVAAVSAETPTESAAVPEPTA